MAEGGPYQNSKRVTTGDGDRRLFKQCSTMIRERQFEQVFQRLFPFADEVIRHETNCVTFFLVLGHLLVSEIKDDEKNRMYFKSLVEELLSSEDHCQSRLNIMIELFPYVPHDLKFLAFLRMMRYSFHTLQKTKFQVFQRQLPFSQIMMWMRPEDKREFFHLYSQILVAQRKMDQFVIFYMHYLKQFPEDIATLHKVLIQTIKLLNFPLMSRLSSELDSTLEPHRHPHPPSADSQTDSATATEPTTATATEPQPQTPDPTVQLFDLVSSLDVNPYRRFRGRHRDLFTKWSISHKDVLSAMRNENKRIRLEEKARRREAKQKERERRRLQKQAAKQGSSPSASGSGDAETDQEMVGEESASASDSASTSTTSGNENEPELKVTVAVLSDEEEAEEAEAHSDDVEGGEDDEEDEEEGEDYEEEEEYEEGEEGEWEEYEEEEEEEDGDS